MKKLLFCLLVMAVSFGLTYSQSITVTAPNGGENWRKATTHSVTWTSSGVSGNVIVQLLQGGRSLGAIYNGANSGSFSWTINSLLNGNAIAPGSYKVQVKSLNDTSIKDQSNSNFTISSPGTDTISPQNISPPAQNAQWCRGRRYTIRWNRSAFNASQVALLLFRGRNQVEVIAHKTTNNGSYPWVIPGKLPESSNYYIGIRMPGQDGVTKGLKFTIKFCGLRRKNDPKRPVSKPSVKPQLPDHQSIKVPDLELTDIFFNTNNNVVAKIKNTGPVAVGKGINMKLDVTTRGTVNIFGGSGAPGERVHINLNPGQEREYVLPFHLQSSFYESQFHRVKIKIEANYDKKLIESNYRNNTLTKNLKPEFRIESVRLVLKETIRRSDGIAFKFDMIIQASFPGNFTWSLKSNYSNLADHWKRHTYSARLGMMKYQTYELPSVVVSCRDAGNYWVEIQITDPFLNQSNRVNISVDCD